MASPPAPLWTPSNVTRTAMYDFMNLANRTHALNLVTYQDLHAWSVDEPSQFWALCWFYFKLPHSGSYQHAIEPNVRLDAIPKFFKGTHLNFAECCLERIPLYSSGKENAAIAITQVREGCTDIKHVTWAELRTLTARLAHAMKDHGVKKGDRVAVVASNSLATLAVFMAVTSLGGLFSSSSTDMGVRGILDRLLQIRPRWVFFDDAALYNGKVIELRDKMAGVVQGMSAVREFQGIVAVPRFETAPRDVAQLARVTTLQAWLGAWATRHPRIEYARVAFGDPFLVVYSSGTTGQPKCIVHSVGGVLMNAMKEGVLHRDTGPHSVALQYTTTGWIMYLSSLLNLLHGARVVLYDGSPFLPHPSTFLHLVAAQKVTKLGVSPRYFSTLLAAGVVPRHISAFPHLSKVTSTGMVLPTALFHWFYSRAGFPPHVHLANISGGTDLAGCFGMENPLTPVYPGGTQGPALGMRVQVYDSTMETPPTGPPPAGTALPANTPGELVATAPFPNMPVMFFPGDPASRQKYHDAYFARFNNVWAHGDFIERDAATGNLVFLGRADGVLNPSGVRFGSAELYNVLEQHFAGRIADAIAVGQRRPRDADERVLLFVKMSPSHTLDAGLVREIRDAIARECSKRHVPAYIFATPEIPTTVNLKKVELPVKQIVSGKRVKASGTLLNPESLEFYYRFVEVEKFDDDGEVGGGAKAKL